MYKCAYMQETVMLFNNNTNRWLSVIYRTMKI